MVDPESAYAENFGSVRSLALSFGIREQEVEDVVQEVFVAVLKPRGEEQQNMLQQHDPRRAKLNTQIGSYAKLSMRNHRDRQTKRDWREVLVQDDEVARHMAFEKDEAEVVLETSVEFDEFVVKIEKALSVMKVRGSRDLRKLFHLISESVKSGDYLDRRQIAKDLGVCDTTLFAMWRDLRKVFVEEGWDQDVSA